MIKQLVINEKKSFDDFGVYISKRTISTPKKKIIKEALPFSNIVYDFSNIDGEIYWEERSLEYEFDIAETSTEEMEFTKSNLLNWLLNIHDTDIYDPYITDYHFHGSYDSDSWSEDFGGGTLKVVFKVYPYMIKNEVNIDEMILTSTMTNALVLVNNTSGHRIPVDLTIDGEMTLSFNNVNYGLSTGKYEKLFYVNKGENKIGIESSSGGIFKIEYREERF